MRWRSGLGFPYVDCALSPPIDLPTGGRVALRSGESAIVLSPIGIEIAARDVTITCSGKLSMKASGDVVMKGSKILQN